MDFLVSQTQRGTQHDLCANSQQAMWPTLAVLPAPARPQQRPSPRLPPHCLDRQHLSSGPLGCHCLDVSRAAVCAVELGHTSVAATSCPWPPLHVWAPLPSSMQRHSNLTPQRGEAHLGKLHPPQPAQGVLCSASTHTWPCVSCQLLAPYIPRGCGQGPAGPGLSAPWSQTANCQHGPAEWQGCGTRPSWHTMT